MSERSPAAIGETRDPIGGLLLPGGFRSRSAIVYLYTPDDAADGPPARLADGDRPQPEVER